MGASVAAVVRFIRIMKGKMESTELKSKKLVYYTGQTPQLRTKSIFFLSEFFFGTRVCPCTYIHRCMYMSASVSVGVVRAVRVRCVKPYLYLCVV